MYNTAGPPWFYEQINRHNAMVDPYTVHVTNTQLAQMFQRYLLQKAMSVFKFKLPQSWDRDYFLYTLFCRGYLAVVNTNKFGVICQQCSLKGLNVYYQPRQAVISNPLLRGILEPLIGAQCALIKLQPDYQGVLDLTVYYSDQMALAAEAFGVNTVNSKFAYLLATSSSQAAQSIKKMYDQIVAGKPAVVVDKALFDTGTGEPNYNIQQINATNPENLISLLSTISQLEIMFDRAVGIPNVSTVKRERELSGELQLNSQNTRSLASLWLEQLQDGLRIANELFGLDLSVDWRMDIEQTISNDAGAVQDGPDTI